MLDENEKEKCFNIEVYSSFDKKAIKKAKGYQYSKFIYSKDARRVRFLTNLKFVLNKRFKFNFDLSQVDLPRSAKKYFQKQQYDAIYVNGYIRGALPIIKYSNAPVIVHHHVVTDILKEPTIKGEQIVNSASKMLFVSDFARDFAKTGNVLQNGKMVTFQNAIDVNKFQPNDKEERRSRIRFQLGINEQDVVILFVGRMVESKGSYELIKAFNQCEFANSVKLLIVGGATYSSKKTTPYVKKCLEEARKNDKIIFTGHINYSELPSYYSASDIATLISRCNEACGLVGIESMAAGLPIITTDRGGIGEYVHKNCKIVVNDDINILSNLSLAMKRLVYDKALRREMGEFGKEHAKRYDKSKYYENFKKIIEKSI